MIFYLVTEDHAYTMQVYLWTWGRSLAPRIEILPYEHIARTPVPLAGTYIFSDLERLSAEKLDGAAALASRLLHSGYRVLNHPGQVKLRYELLGDLYEQGQNTFQAYRPAETQVPERFPVFLRTERGHEVCSPLLTNRQELAGALQQAEKDGHGIDDLLMIEFRDTSDAHGLFRVYGAFIVGDRIIAHHVHFGPDWNGHGSDAFDEPSRREEWEYASANPHEEWLRQTFAAANIQYGRMDYGLLNGKPQVWEINTNPIVAMPRRHYIEKRWSIPARELVAAQLNSAFEALDHHPAPAWN